MRLSSAIFLAVMTTTTLFIGESAFATGYYRAVFIENTVDPIKLQFEYWNYECSQSPPWTCWTPAASPPDDSNPLGTIRSYTISNQSPKSLTAKFTLDDGYEGYGGPYVFAGGWNFVDPKTGALRHTIQISSECETNPCVDLPFEASVEFRSALGDGSLSMVPGGTLSEGQLSYDLWSGGANQVLFFEKVESMSAAFKVVPEPNALALVLVGFAAMGVAMRRLYKVH